MQRELGVRLPESYSGFKRDQDSTKDTLARPREEILIRDLLARSATRRGFIKGVGLVAAMTVPGLILHERPKPVHEMDRADFIEQLKGYSYRLYAHNGADKDSSLEEALQSNIPNTEIDVQWYNKKLYVAHNAKDLKRLNSTQLANREFDRIVERVVAAGKNPAFDLKLEEGDEEGFEEFQLSVARLVPEDRLTTFSGKEFSFLDQIPSNPARIVTYTIDSDNFTSSLGGFNQRVNTWQQEGITGRGMVVHVKYADPRLLQFNRQRGLETNVWDVSSERGTLELLRNGATGITSDNTAMLEAMALAA